MVHEPLPVKTSEVTPPVTGAVLASRQREDRRPSQSGDKKRARPTPPPKTDTPPARTDDEGDPHEIDVLA